MGPFLLRYPRTFMRGPQKPMLALRLTLLPTLLLLIGISTAVTAETLRIPAQITSDEGLPQRGKTMATIESRYGAPETRHASVGGGNAQRPPIVRWDYAGFYVVFERDRVILAAPKNRAVKPVRESDDLEVRTEPLRSSP